MLGLKALLSPSAKACRRSATFCLNPSLGASNMRNLSSIAVHKINYPSMMRLTRQIQGQQVGSKLGISIPSARSYETSPHLNTKFYHENASKELYNCFKSRDWTTIGELFAQLEKPKMEDVFIALTACTRLKDRPGFIKVWKTNYKPIGNRIPQIEMLKMQFGAITEDVRWFKSSWKNLRENHPQYLRRLPMEQIFGPWLRTYHQYELSKAVYEAVLLGVPLGTRFLYSWIVALSLGFQDSPENQVSPRTISKVLNKAMEWTSKRRAHSLKRERIKALRKLRAENPAAYQAEISKPYAQIINKYSPSLNEDENAIVKTEAGVLKDDKNRPRRHTLKLDFLDNNSKSLYHELKLYHLNRTLPHTILQRTPNVDGSAYGASKRRKLNKKRHISSSTILQILHFIDTLQYDITVPELRSKILELKVTLLRQGLTETKPFDFLFTLSFPFLPFPSSSECGGDWIGKLGHIDQINVNPNQIGTVRLNEHCVPAVCLKDTQVADRPALIYYFALHKDIVTIQSILNIMKQGNETLYTHPHILASVCMVPELRNVLWGFSPASFIDETSGPRFDAPWLDTPPRKVIRDRFVAARNPLDSNTFFKLPGTSRQCWTIFLQSLDLERQSLSLLRHHVLSNCPQFDIDFYLAYLSIKDMSTLDAFYAFEELVAHDIACWFQIRDEIQEYAALETAIRLYLCNREYSNLQLPTKNQSTDEEISKQGNIEQPIRGKEFRSGPIQIPSAYRHVYMAVKGSKPVPGTTIAKLYDFVGYVANRVGAKTQRLPFVEPEPNPQLYLSWSKILSVLSSVAVDTLKAQDRTFSPLLIEWIERAKINETDSILKPREVLELVHFLDEWKVTKFGESPRLHSTS